GLRSEDLAKQFYYRAYFNMTAIGRVWERMGMPSDSLERLTGSGAKGQGGLKFSPSPKMAAVMPYMIGFLLRHLFIADQLESRIPSIRSGFEALGREDLTALSEEELMDRVDRLTERLQDPIYFNVVIPLASSLLGRRLEARLREVGVEPSKVDFLAGAEVRRYYPNEGLKGLHRAYDRLSGATKSAVDERGLSALAGDPLGEAFRKELEAFLREFGHLSESGNDFSSKPWREDPGLVLELVVHYPDEVGRDGRRQLEQLELPPKERRRVLSSARRARRMSVLKERVSSTYTYGYGLYRNYFMEVGRRLADRKLLGNPEDVFYLSLDELRQIVSGGCAGNTCNNYRLRAMLRQREMEELRHVEVPSVIRGGKAPPLTARRSGELTGTPTSRGRHRGRARVVRGPGEISRLEKGDVLVIPYSDVSWTPLFAKAGAVVAESGGMLSHTSIVAREYGIPAGVSVEGALGIPEGTEVIVDGDAGTVSFASLPP
ncbi:MAG: PEP-utilizing enzyme, partial [Methanomassiliicoccales archaeon]|nr:PEP-utilizing enzyme [Methanomassiliicoccales archaeon]